MNSHKIYHPEEVTKVQLLHQSILEQRLSYPSIFAELDDYSINLQRHFNVSNPAVLVEISNYHPKLIAATPKALFDYDMTLTDFQLTIAKAYGFEDWEEVKKLSTVKHNSEFEMAIDLLLSGNIEALEDHLIQYPDIVNQRSHYGHQAGLIHYLGSNGIEIWRQIVPSNLEDILRLLIKLGANPDMMANLYGVNNLLALLTSSDHAWKAGVAKQTIRRLRTRTF